jgi:hypothetical protein
MMRQVEQYGAKVISMCIEKEPLVKTCFVGPFGGCTSERCYHSHLCCLLCVGPAWDRRAGACSLNAGAKMSMWDGHRAVGPVRAHCVVAVVLKRP